MSAIGRGLDATLDALRTGRSGLAPCDFAGIGAAGGHVGRVRGVEEHRLPATLARFDCRNNRLADLALGTDGFAQAVAAAQASATGAGRIAVVVGTSTSGILSLEEAWRERNPETGALPDWFDYEGSHDMLSLARFVRAALGLRGPALTLSSACASTARSFLDAAHLIESGICDAAVVGGADSLCRLTLRGFAALELIAPAPVPALRRRAQRHLDRRGGGFRAVGARGTARIGVALVGCGASSDGYHMSAPDPSGAGAVAAMRAALASAGLAPDAIDYVNLHGTGTRANDAMEDAASPRCSAPGPRAARPRAGPATRSARRASWRRRSPACACARG